MKNKLIIKEHLLKLSLTLGCYDAKIEKLSKKDLKKILDNLEFGCIDISTDKYIAEVYHVDNEVDISLTTSKEYAKTYGRIFTDAK